MLISVNTSRSGFQRMVVPVFARVRRLLGVAFLGAGLVFALFKVQAVLEAVTDNGDVHVLRGILRRAGTETVETK